MYNLHNIQRVIISEILIENENQDEYKKKLIILKLNKKNIDKICDNFPMRMKTLENIKSKFSNLLFQNFEFSKYILLHFFLTVIK